MLKGVRLRARDSFLSVVCSKFFRMLVVVFVFSEYFFRRDGREIPLALRVADGLALQCVACLRQP